MIDRQELSWDEARNQASQSFQRLPIEEVSLAQGVDRTLALDCVALCDLPTYTTSSMDGWAVSGEGPWRIVGDVKAGLPLDKVLETGTAVRIATGAVIPIGTFAVARWEIANVVDRHVHATVNALADIRPAGEECQKGDLLVPKGTKLSPAWIGLLAASGYDTIRVISKPRVAMLLLGDELLRSDIPHSGRVRDSLGPQVPAWLERLGAEVISLTYVSDELEAVIEAIKANMQSCDLILTTGGTADGARDHIHSALASFGASFIVDRVKSRPGHPMLLARIPLGEERYLPLLGLPGNPHSAVVGLMTLGAPLVASLLGQVIPHLNTVITANELSAPADFTRLILGNLIDGHFEMGDHLGSAMLRGLARSTGFAVTGSGITPIGGLIRWLPLP